MPLMAFGEAELAQQLERRLADAGAGVRRRRAKKAGVTFEHGGLTFVVQPKLSRDARASILRSLLAEAILEARARKDGGAARALPVVGAPSISDAMADELRQFVRRVAPKQAWGLADSRGRLEIYINASAAISLPPEEERQRPLARVARRPTLFSDVSQWLLKVILAPELPPELLTAPRGESIASNRDLARIAGVSLGSAGNFLAALEAEGHVERGRRGLLLTRRRELFDAWRTAARPRSTTIGMSWVVAPSKPMEGLRAVVERLDQASIRSALALHAACDALGLGFVHGAKPTLCVERFDPAVLHGLGLVVAKGSSPDVFVSVPSAPRSCFSGTVERRGVRATDVLQSWLDVSWHPARGQEQADHLWSEVLEPRLLAHEVHA